MLIGNAQDQAAYKSELSRQVCCWENGVMMGRAKLPVGKAGIPVGAVVNALASSVVVTVAQTVSLAAFPESDLNMSVMSNIETS